VKRQERNEILTRHRISQHTLPNLLYFLFFPLHIFHFSANPHLLHWQAAQADTQTKACQRVCKANAPREIVFKKFTDT